MTAFPSVDPAQFLNEQLAQASPDLMRDLLTTFVNALLSAQADAVCGAGYGERSSDRVNSRNGYRHRDLGKGSGWGIAGHRGRRGLGGSHVNAHAVRRLGGELAPCRSTELTCLLCGRTEWTVLVVIHNPAPWV